MILLAGDPAEAPLRLAIEAAQSLGAEHAVFDEDQAAACDLTVDAGPGGLSATLDLADGRTIALDDTRAVYFRLLGQPGEDRARLLHQLFAAWLDAARCLVVNRPAAIATNGSKPYQAQLIARAGFAVPATLVTNDPGAVRRFAARHGRVVYKSTSSVRSIVAELTPGRLAELERVRALPTQFQELVPGVDVRVHVVGRDVFSCEAHSPAVDYRYASRSGHDVRLEPVELDESTRGACTALASGLGLHFAGVDLRRTPSGGYVCFEVNPCPAYSWYQEETGQPIAQALVRYLLAGPSSPERRET